MTPMQSHPISHDCRGCGRHFDLQDVRQVYPAEHIPEGEAEVLVCPVCGSYDIEPLVAVIPDPSTTNAEAHHCTVVFCIPGTREVTREFLRDLATQYPGTGSSPEIVAIQAGYALRKEDGANA